MSEIAIRAESLAKEYRIGAKTQRYGTLRDSLSEAMRRPAKLLRSHRRRSSVDCDREESFWALSDISFEVRRGETIGIIGRNGAGKSTLLKVLSRITEPTRGSAEVFGRIGSLLEVGTGFHPELTGRENIILSGSILGMRKREIDRRFDEIVSFAAVERFVDMPVKHYSSGMYLRLAFAVAAHLETEILLVDEVLAVGDAEFQQKCLGKMKAVAQQGRTVLFVSHNMGAVRGLCTRGMVLRDGCVATTGTVTECINAYYQQITGDSSDTGTGSAGRKRRDEVFGAVRSCGGNDRTLLQSQHLELATSVTLPEGISGFYLMCMLEDSDGRRLFALSESSQSLGLGKLSPTRYGIRLRVPPLWLSPGLYSAYFKILFWGAYGSTRHVSDKFPIDVQGANSTSDVPLHPQAAWTMSESHDGSHAG